MKWPVWQIIATQLPKHSPRDVNEILLPTGQRQKRLKSPQNNSKQNKTNTHTQKRTHKTLGTNQTNPRIGKVLLHKFVYQQFTDPRTELNLDLLLIKQKESSVIIQELPSKNVLIANFLSTHGSRYNAFPWLCHSETVPGV